MTFAVDEINAAGGVAGRKLRIEIVDIDIMTPEGTIAAIQIAQRQACPCHRLGLRADPATGDGCRCGGQGSPYLHGNTAISSLELVKSNPAKYKNIFEIDPAETWYGYGFVRYLDKFAASGGWKPKNNKIHIVQEQIAYTQVISKSVQKAIAESSGRWARGAITDIQFPVQDWAPVLRAMHETDAGVIFIDHWVAAELAAFARSSPLIRSRAAPRLSAIWTEPAGIPQSRRRQRRRHDLGNGHRHPCRCRGQGLPQDLYEALRRQYGSSSIPAAATTR